MSSILHHAIKTAKTAYKYKLSTQPCNTNLSAWQFPSLRPIAVPPPQPTVNGNRVGGAIPPSPLSQPQENPTRPKRIVKSGTSTSAVPRLRCCVPWGDPPMPLNQLYPSQVGDQHGSGALKGILPSIPKACLIPEARLENRLYARRRISRAADHVDPPSPYSSPFHCSTQGGRREVGGGAVRHCLGWMWCWIDVVGGLIVRWAPLSNSMSRHLGTWRASRRAIEVLGAVGSLWRKNPTQANMSTLEFRRSKYDSQVGS